MAGAIPYSGEPLIHLWRRSPPPAAPGFLQWSFGGRAFTSPVTGKGGNFQIHFRPSIPYRRYDFRAEVQRACASLDQARGKRKIALCYSGGVDSELMARQLAECGIPFEMYFLDIWGKNREIFDQWAPRLEKDLGQRAHVVSLPRAHFYEEHSLRVFSEFGCEQPTYLALTYLFEQIPRDQFILAGDGDLNRSGPLFRQIAAASPPPPEGNGIFIPFSFAAVFLYLWAERARRAGEFAFFSRTPELLASVITDPLFERRYPESSTRNLIYAAFPEIAPRPKSTNWDGENYRENVWIRTWLEEHVPRYAGIKNWRMGTGAVARVSDLFLPA